MAHIRPSRPDSGLGVQGKVLGTLEVVPLVSSLLLSSLELSDRKVYEPYMRALLGTAAHFCEVVVLKLHASPPRSRCTFL